MAAPANTMPSSEAAWRSLHETHLANLRSHRALLDHLASLHVDGETPELDAMRARAERIWEDAVRAGEIMEVADKAEKRIVIANIPWYVTATGGLSPIWCQYDPVDINPPFRKPTRSEIHLYDLPAGDAHRNGIIKVPFHSAASAARAIRDLDGVKFPAEEGHTGLIARRYRPGADPVDGDDAARTKNKKRVRRVSSGESLQRQQQQQRGSKRQRTNNGINTGHSIPAAASHAARDDDPPATAAAAPTYPFTFTTTAVPQQQSPSPPPPPPAPSSTAAVVEPEPEPEPEFEDISAEVDARLAEQAARRAAATATRQKTSAAAGWKKRGREARRVEEEEGDEADEAAVAGMAGMALVDRRPRKRRMREEGREWEGEGVRAEEGVGDGVSEEGRRQPQQTSNGGPAPASKARVRKERRSAVVREREERGESPRPMKRSRRGL
ncbi:uncharacterized protein BKCO1_2400039 [Diplodia corticola]|uniref:Uncharacterized protein n=1 Tax=Diplodia corticola TaxID=236234 RepID=A0A1J9R1U2_9PEZI|nr:uncharacterized protein BKCO1_2400039 [Diplodia corticola]OJD34218.1 hypothetical protein BKCO1_2400039 [Diplodia corticola]